MDITILKPDWSYSSRVYYGWKECWVFMDKSPRLRIVHYSMRCFSPRKTTKRNKTPASAQFASNSVRALARYRLIFFGTTNQSFFTWRLLKKATFLTFLKTGFLLWSLKHLRRIFKMSCAIFSLRLILEQYISMISSSSLFLGFFSQQKAWIMAVLFYELVPYRRRQKVEDKELIEMLW